MYRKVIKRILDFVVSFCALVILCVPMAIIAVLVRIKLGAPVIYKQERPGKNEQIFSLYKFRTMTNAKDGDGNLLPDSDRCTAFGNKLRATSLDELPELFNILKGDMSIVGPRPLLVRYLPYYTDDERHRHDVLPGLTGLAQINGRNYLRWEERFALDLQYVNSISFKMDCYIIIQTVKKVFAKEDIMDLQDNQNLGFSDLDKERSAK